MKNIIGESGCYIFIYWQTIGNFAILLQSFFMATFRYICLLHDDFLLRFRLSPTVSIWFSSRIQNSSWKSRQLQLSSDQKIILGVSSKRFPQRIWLLYFHLLAIQLQSFFIAIFCYICPLNEDFLIIFNLSPTKAWLPTYFDLPHSQLRNPKAVCNCAQLAFLIVATRNSQPQLYYIEVPNSEF